ncbi:hypothetical protein FMEXI_11472 [Fusarium mexicanum]|uniref:Myb-like domain-containing protein n=1 Tax=Fusarium mexicanum TaxID=751941 RepID=A0A8H5ML42_9HYPO|nr:hypothetical protein FMEXI_11472 [Fusarium mexicanum]
MERYAKVVMAPRKPDPGDKSVSIFLAGITTSTGEPDWREVLTNDLMNHRVTIMNPNRPDWDVTWKEDFSDKRWEEQVWWELDMQEAADIIVFMFHPSTDAPISLMELGLAVKSKSKRIIVCAQDGYRKKGNVEADSGTCRQSKEGTRIKVTPVATPNQRWWAESEMRRLIQLRNSGESWAAIIAQFPGRTLQGVKQTYRKRRFATELQMEKEALAATSAGPCLTGDDAKKSS